MATTLPNSGLKIQDAYGESQWFADHHDNWVRLYTDLLKVSELLDVDVTGISSGDVLAWNVSSSKWEPYTPTHNPLGAPKTSTTTSTTTTTTTTTVWMLQFTGEDYTIPPVIKKNFQIELDGDIDHFCLYADSLQYSRNAQAVSSYSMWSRFMVTGDPVEFYAVMDAPAICHPSGGNNWALCLNLWDESKTKIVGSALAINYYNGYRRNFQANIGMDPIVSEDGVTNSANAPMDRFYLRIYKGGTTTWVWYYKDGIWQYDSDPLGYRIDDVWYAGPVWVELHAERQATGGAHDWRLRTFSILRGTMTYPSTTTTTTTTTNTLTTTTQTVPLLDEGMEPSFPVSWITLSDNDKLATRDATYSGWRGAISKAYVMQGMPEGNRFYFEVHCLDALSRYFPWLGTQLVTNTSYGGAVMYSGFGLNYTGNYVYDGGAIGSQFATWIGPAVFGFAFDITLVHLNLGKAWMSKDGVWDSNYHDTGSTEIPYLRPIVSTLGTLGSKFYAGCTTYYGSGRSWRLMTRSEDWTYTPPTGFVAMPSNDVA